MNTYSPLLGALAVLVASGTGHAGSETAFPARSATSPSSAMGHAEGTIVEIDVAQGRITLKHGAIQGLGMPAMTMVFRVADPAMLLRVKPGDLVGFSVTRSDNFFTVTQLLPRSTTSRELPSIDSC